MCESRGNTVYLVDPPFGLRPQEVVDWHNGMLFSDLAAAINSSYGALYWGWTEIFDQYNNTNIWVPPSGHVAAIISKTGVGPAPAGVKRGVIRTASQPETDLLYGNENAVNPLVNIPKVGITIFGQRTLDRTDEPTNRVDVRILINSIKDDAIKLMRQFLFEPNNSNTWSQVKNTLDPYFANLIAQGWLSGYSVVCDASNNTDIRRNSHQLWVSIFVQPTPTAEFIVVNLVQLQTGASFSASEVLAAGGIVGS